MFVLAVDLEVQSLLLETRAAADRAGHFLEEMLLAGLFPLAFLLVARRQLGKDAGERRHLHIRFGRTDAQQFLGTVEDHLKRLFRDVPDGVVQRELVFAGDGFQVAEHRIAAHRPDAFDAAVGDRTAAVGDDLVEIHPRHGAQAAAVRAGSLRGIEREGIGGRHLERKARVGAHEVAAEVLQIAVFKRQDAERALSLAEGRVHGLPDAFAVVFGRDQLVDHQFHEVDLVAVERARFGQVGQLPVDAHLRVALALQLDEQFPVVPLAPADERGQQEHFLTGVLPEDETDDFLIGIPDHLLAALRRKGQRGPGVEQAEEVVDLRDGAHRGAGIAAHGLLLDRDHGAQAPDFVDVGPLEDADELAGVGRKRIHIPPLPFGADRVEGQGTLPAARQAGHHDQRVARDVQVDVLEVVDPGADDGYLFAFRHIMPVAGKDW